MNRRGFQLTEVMLATLLVVGPMLLTFQVVRASTRQVAHLQDFIDAELMLTNVIEVLSSQARDEALRAAEGGLASLLERVRAASGTDDERMTRVRQCLSTGQLVLEPAEGSKSLMALTIAARMEGAEFKLQRLIRFTP
jgi:CHASE3 domain sensor protein